MEWMHHYKLFLFDLDGLLVNTEELHFLAYKEMLLSQGVPFNWDFSAFCMHAHYSSKQLKNAIYSQYPTLSSDWETHYAEKKERLVHLLEKGGAHLMPGTQTLLETLEKEKIPSCVVTNSEERFVSMIRKKNPILNTIPHWVTRGDYVNPKPDPECYFKAIQLYAKKNDPVIGFEDTPKGINALLKTGAKSILISTIAYPEIPELQSEGVLVFPSLEEIQDSPLLLKKDREEKRQSPLDACL